MDIEVANPFITLSAYFTTTATICGARREKKTGKKGWEKRKRGKQRKKGGKGGKKETEKEGWKRRKKGGKTGGRWERE